MHESGRTYSVRNLTRNVSLAEKAKLADSGWARVKGLIGCASRDFVGGMALWIEPSQGIHTFGMAFPIDVAYLNAKRCVIRIYRRLPPNRIAALSLKTWSIIELPAGTLEQTGTQVGDQLEFVSNVIMRDAEYPGI